MSIAAEDARNPIATANEHLDRSIPASLSAYRGADFTPDKASHFAPSTDFAIRRPEAANEAHNPGERLELLGAASVYIAFAGSPT